MRLVAVVGGIVRLVAVETRDCTEMELGSDAVRTNFKTFTRGFKSFLHFIVNFLLVFFIALVHDSSYPY